jgi:hypothetical protein
MNNFLRTLSYVSLAYLVCLLAAGLAGLDPRHPGVFVLAVLLALYADALDAGLRLPRLVWQSPAMFRNAGLFLKWGDRRWRLVRVTVR